MNLKGLINRISLPRKPSREERRRLILAINSWVLYYLLKRIFNEFMVKAKGGTDSLGVKWEPLSESRRIYKPLRGDDRKLFTPGQGTKKAQLANRESLINIDTTRLARSLRPGKVVSGMYVTIHPNQKAVVTTTRIGFETTVPYADEVQARRPYIPDNIDPWLNDSIELALKKVQQDIRLYVPKK